MNFAARIDTRFVADEATGRRGFVYHVHCYCDGRVVESFAAASVVQARAIAADWLVRRELEQDLDVIDI